MTERRGRVNIAFQAGTVNSNLKNGASSSSATQLKSGAEPAKTKDRRYPHVRCFGLQSALSSVSVSDSANIYHF